VSDVIKGLIACVIDEDIVRAIDNGRRSGRAAADWFVLRTLRRLGANVKVVAAVERDSRTIEELIRLKPRLAVNLAFCSLASEPSFAGALETLGIPYTGSGPVGIGLANDKVRSRRLMATAGIPVPRFVELPPADRPATIDFSPPYFVKPAQSGNSVGVCTGSLVDTFELALKQADRIWRTLDDSAVCDQFIAGREFHAGLIENARGEFKTTGIIELRFAGARAGRGFSTQVSKVNGKDRRAYRVRCRRASLTARKSRELTNTAVDVARLLQLRGYAKIDFRMDDDERITVIEANPNPALWNGEIWQRPSFELNLQRIMRAALRKADE
jgi:D-alanine-D-alanine ligase